MQDFIDQATKNGVVLYQSGKCQFCGADYHKGIFECMSNYNNGIEYLDFNSSKFHLYRFLSVDAHALQHPEIHGRWSNHFHLTRLNLILDKKQIWTYQKSPILSHFLNEYKTTHLNEFLVIPKPQERGFLTAKHIAEAKSTEECIDLIKSWATEVYNAWNTNHLLISQIANNFLSRNNG